MAFLMQYMYIKRAQDKEYISEKGSVNMTTPGLRRYYTEENKKLLENPLKLTAQLLKLLRYGLKLKLFYHQIMLEIQRKF